MCNKKFTVSMMYCAHCCAVVKQHIIATAIIFICHNSSILINDAPLFKAVAFHVALFDAALFNLALFDDALFDVVLIKAHYVNIVLLFDVPLFSCCIV